MRGNTPPDHSVSKIKIMLSGILRSHAELKDIEVCGEISSSNGTYYLSDGKVGIRCLITREVSRQFKNLLVRGGSVVVKGQITLYTNPGFNEYEINVDNITSVTNGLTALSISQVEKQLLKIIESQSELTDVRIKGKINSVRGMPKGVLSLKDSDGSAILCEFHNNELPNQDREEVFVRGKIFNFSTKSRIQYRIDVAQTEPCSPDDSIAQCQCSGCKSCHPRDGNQSCPSLQDPEYELCPECYHESPDREDRVVQAVYAYFAALGGNGFSPKKEQHIQIGSDDRRADVVLVNGNESFAAIAECKGAGYLGHGIEQLNAYLSASDTPFGIFANRVDPEQWEFYKKQGQNQYQQIPCDQFKKEVKELTDPDLQSARNQIAILTSKNDQLRRTQQDVQKELEEVQISLRSAARGIDRASRVISENVPNPSSSENE